MQPQLVERKPKTIFNVDSPYAAIQWPHINPDEQHTILELLCSLLAPLGHHRRTHIEPSKGKRLKKSKAHNHDMVAETERAIANNPPTEPPEPPVLTSYLTIGFNSTTRHLESLSQTSKPKALRRSNVKSTSNPHPGKPDRETAKEKSSIDPIASQEEISLQKHIAAVFVPRSSQPSVLHAHLPVLTYTASMAHPFLPPTRLVTLPKGSEVKLCEALALPRISFIGIMEDAPHATPLIEYVRQHVSAIEVPWLQRAARGEYLPVHISAIQTTAPVGPKAKKGRPKPEDGPKGKRGRDQDGTGSNWKKVKRGEMAEQRLAER